MKKLRVRQKIASAQGYRSAVSCAVRKGAIADKEQTGYNLSIEREEIQCISRCP